MPIANLPTVAPSTVSVAGGRAAARSSPAPRQESAAPRRSRWRQDGFEILVHGRDAARGAETVRAIETAGGTRRASSPPRSPTRATCAASRSMPATSTCSSTTAAYAWFGATADLDAAGFDALFASNVRSAYLLVAAIAPRMAARGRGSIVNLASVAGTIGLAGGAAYGATKAALGVADARLGGRVQPGRRARQRGRARDRSTPAPPRSTASPRSARPRSEARGQPEEIGALIAFLASDAASYLTGATLAADGGRGAI